MIIGAIIGLIGSIIPEAIKLYKEKQDFKREKELLELQIRYQKEMASIRLQEAKELASIELDKATYDFATPTEIKPTGKTWLDALQVASVVYNQTVRPTITYLVIAGWLLVKFAMWQNLGGSLTTLPQIWTEQDNEFVSAVVMFWFGGRAFSRTFKR